ncbi:MAG: hypothetical protein AB7T31_04460 [Gemmatimonadales bacterium]
MRPSRTLTAILSFALSGLAASGVGAQGRVTVNRVELGADILQALAQNGIQVAPGDYWYDATSGLFGLMGGPGLGFTMPALQMGGPLAADASGGGSGTLTGVFVNGRELHPQDVAALSTLGPVYPGRYWLRFDGWYGIEGGQPLGNLIMLAQQASGGAGYNRSSLFGHLGSDGQSSYFFDPNSGCSVMSGGGGVSC